MKKLIFLFCFYMIFPAYAVDIWGIYDDKSEAICKDISLTGTMDLAQAMEKAICANTSLKISYFAVLTSDAEYGQGLSNYLPTITGTGTLNTSGDKYEGDKTFKDSEISASAKLSWLVLDMGGRNASAKRLKAFVESAYFSYDSQLQELLYQVASTYYAVLSAEEKHEGLLKAEESYKKSLEQATSRYQLGLVPLSDKLQAQTSYDQARLASTLARKNIAIELGNLTTYLNLSPDVHLKLKRPNKKITDSRHVGAFDELVKKALLQRPDYLSAQKNLEATQKQIDIARSNALPSLSANANAGTTKDIKYGINANYKTSAGLTLSVPLFTGFSNSYKIDQAHYQYQQALKSLEETQNTIENEVWTTVQEYQTALESFNISKSLLASAQENERVAFASYKVGKVNILTLLDAQASLASARVEHSTAFYSFLTYKAKLQKVLGQMERIK